VLFIQYPCHTGVWALACGSLGDFGVLGALYNTICNVRNLMCLVTHYLQRYITEARCQCVLHFLNSVVTSEANFRSTFLGMPS